VNTNGTGNEVVEKSRRTLSVGVVGVCGGEVRQPVYFCPGSAGSIQFSDCQSDGLYCLEWYPGITPGFSYGNDTAQILIKIALQLNCNRLHGVGLKIRHLLVEVGYQRLAVGCYTSPRRLCLFDCRISIVERYFLEFWSFSSEFIFAVYPSIWIVDRIHYN
jgi:hypothetical protein